MWGSFSKPLVYGVHSMNIGRSKHLIATFAFLALAACADSTGPGSVGDEDAMRSLTMGLSSAAGAPLPFALSPSALGTAARGIDRINVGIDGTPQAMYALGLRVTYPTGTCMENLVVFSPPIVGFGPQCTPPPLGLLLVLWQTRSGSRPPERLILISGDVGTSNFANIAALPLGPTDYSFFPAFAIQVNDREEFWTSIGGVLESQVTATSESCNVPPPAFAKSSSCNVAAFAESGQITFERFDFNAFTAGPPPPRQTMELVIPSQSIRGILQAITEIKPVTVPAGPWDY